MLGFLKNMFGKPVEKTNGHSHSLLPPPAKPAVDKPKTSTTAFKPLTPVAPVRPLAPKPPVPAKPVAATTMTATNGTDGPSVQLPLHIILPILPLEVKARIRQAGIGDLSVALPAGRVIAQLSLGTVKISFGELRALVPGVFSPESDLDGVELILPLNEVLARLNPSMLARRQNQKQVEIPAEIGGPFGAGVQGVTFGSTKPASVTPPRAIAPATPIKPVVPGASVIPPVKSAPVQPVQQPIAFRNSVLSAPTPPPPAAPSGPPPTIPAPVAFRGVGASTPPISPEPIRLATPPPAATQSVPGEPALSLPLASVSENWPESLRVEIAQLNLTNARLAVPANLIGAALKQGRVAFTWKTLRTWMQPSAPVSVSAHDGASVELPLNVIAPLFMGLQKNAAKPAAKRIAIDETIPNLFFGFPQGEAPVVPGEEPAPQPSRAVTKPVDTNFYVWDDNAESARVDETEYKRKPASGTEFLSRVATPNEVVSRAAALEGVAGALIALPDGLMVASKLAPELNGDTLAAFLPHIFGKVSQCTKELRMGDLNNLNFTVGNTPWKIFRVNAIFFAAFGYTGKPLPGVELAALAAELDRKKK